MGHSSDHDEIFRIILCWCLQTTIFRKNLSRFHRIVCIWQCSNLHSDSDLVGLDRRSIERQIWREILSLQILLMHGFRFASLPCSCCLCLDSKWFLVGIRIVSCSPCIFWILRGAKHHHDSKYDVSQKSRVCCECLQSRKQDWRNYWDNCSWIHSE